MKEKTQIIVEDTLISERPTFSSDEQTPDYWLSAHLTRLNKTNIFRSKFYTNYVWSATTLNWLSGGDFHALNNLKGLLSFLDTNIS